MEQDHVAAFRAMKDQRRHVATRAASRDFANENLAKRCTLVVIAEVVKAVRAADSAGVATRAIVEEGYRLFLSYRPRNWRLNGWFANVCDLGQTVLLRSQLPAATNDLPQVRRMAALVENDAAGPALRSRVSGARARLAKRPKRRPFARRADNQHACAAALAPEI